MPEARAGAAPGRQEAGALEPAGFIYSLPGVLALVLGYAIVHVGLRLLASGNLGEHDPVDNVLIQSLAGGYRVDTPPLYDWLLWSLQQLFGAGVQAFLFLKYGLLVVIAAFMFLVAHRISGRALWGVVAVEGLSLVYQIFWRFHESYTDLVGAMALTMAGFWALTRVVDRGARRDYLLFAGVAALGLVTQYAYAVLVVALFLAAAFQADIRRRLWAPPMLLLIPAIVLVAYPYARWLAADPGRSQAWLAMLSPHGQILAAFAHAEKRMLVDALMSLAPLVFFLPMVFPGALRTMFRPTPASAPDYSRLIGHALLIELAVLALAVGLDVPLLTGIAVQNYLPMSMLGIVWLTEMARRSAPHERNLKRYFQLTVFIALLAVGVRSANMFVSQPVCKICRWGVPYAGLADQIRGADLDDAAFVASDVELAGNLRRFFPDSRFFVPSLQNGRPEAGKPVLVVGDGAFDSRTMKDKVLPYLPPGTTPDRLRVETFRVPWHHLWRPLGYRYSDWWLVEIVPVSGKP